MWKLGGQEQRITCPGVPMESWLSFRSDRGPADPGDPYGGTAGEVSASPSRYPAAQPFSPCGHMVAQPHRRPVASSSEHTQP